MDLHKTTAFPNGQLSYAGLEVISDLIAENDLIDPFSDIIVQIHYSNGG